ncbi:MAG: sel1 repeat family protein [Oxalobacteraceae bacterium]|nr:sel1 repeat family protein [Oxalobacteraceae bacterium]
MKGIHKSSLQQLNNIGDGMKQLIAILLMTFPVIALGAEPASDLTQLVRSAQSGDAKAQFTLGLKYAQADGVARNEAEGTKWLMKSAEQGYTDAEFIVGVMYANGEGVKRSNIEAGKWFLRAANKGSADAQFNLGMMNAQGIGMRVNKPQAYRWYSLAAAQGNQPAQDEKSKLEKTMSAAELTEAKRLSAGK